MALFLTGHSAEKIMLLGRWKSSCFLDYIHSQVIEWVNLFSVDMISFEHFFELFKPKDRKKIDSLKEDFKISNIVQNYEKRNGRLRNSVFNRTLGQGTGSHTLYASVPISQFSSVGTRSNSHKLLCILLYIGL